MRREERKLLQEMQMERIAQSAFCILKQKLYENKDHTWDDFLHSTQGQLGSFTITTGVETKKEVICSYVITRVNHCNKKNEKSGLVVEVNLTFDQSWQFQRTLYLERHPAS